ncbi:hypothetical protein HDK77DRAFT_165728 [Phyllosticta capitalensis]
MRSFAPTLLTAFLLLFFSTATSAFKYRKFPYTIECEGNRRDINRYELKHAGRDSIRGDRKRHPFYYEANKFDGAGNCKDLSLPLYKRDFGTNGLLLYFAFDEPGNTIWYCAFELYDNFKGDYQCKNNYDRHTYGSDVPPPFDDETVDDGEHWSRR